MHAGSVTRMNQRFSSRLLVFTLMAIMVLGQFYLFTHQMEHALEESDHSCPVCELADHQSGGLTPLLPVVTAPLGDKPEATHSYSYNITHNVHYLSRAPPTHISI